MNKKSAKELDLSDSLSQYAKEFYKPKNTIYLDGNSLGLCSKRAERKTLEFLDSWKKLGIEGWTSGTDPWFYLAEELGELMAPLIGANKNEVICTGSTTINLHQLLTSFYRPRGKRVKIIADELNFPSDIYAIKSHLVRMGRDVSRDLILVKSQDGLTLNEDEIIKSFSDEVALIVLPVVLYRSGQLLNVEKITRVAHRKGILIAFDAAHSIGTLPHHFHRDHVDFGFWCTYKYLNGGPGSAGGLYVNEKYLDGGPGIAGWFSSDKNKQFDMNLSLTPAETIGKYQIGTPHILSMAGLKGSLEFFHEVGIEKLRRKSLALTKYLIELVDTELAPLGVKIITPRKPGERGGHIAITHPQAIQIARSLRERGVIPDFRPPNIIRLAPVALYTSFSDIKKAVQIMKKIITDRSFEKYEQKRSVVS